jgi:hypothetical protein
MKLLLPFLLSVPSLAGSLPQCVLAKSVPELRSCVEALAAKQEKIEAELELLRGEILILQMQVEGPRKLKKK